METEQLVKVLNEHVPFPRHGWVVDANNQNYLLFPLKRAITERGPSEAKQSTAVPRLRMGTFYQMTYFLKSWHRTLQVLSQIARLEKDSSTDLRDGLTRREAEPIFRSYEMLPIWTEYFFIHFRILADRLTHALGPLVTKKPEQFPRNYRALLNKAEKEKASFPEWQVDSSRFLAAISDNNRWFHIMATTRDALSHRFSETTIVRGLGRTEVLLQSKDKDVPPRDILSEIPSVIDNFCECLSAFPADLWIERRYVTSDYVRFESGWRELERFFPKVSLSA